MRSHSRRSIRRLSLRAAAWSRRLAYLGCLLLVAANCVVYAQPQTAVALAVEDAEQISELLRNEDTKGALERLSAPAAASPLHTSGTMTSIVGLLNLTLQQQRSGDVYDALYEWTMPSGDRRDVRLLTSLVPQTGPPSEFARALGSRPKRDFFRPAMVGEMSGIFCSGWALLAAADDAGRLRQFVSELRELSADEHPHAQLLTTLADIYDSRSDRAALATVLNSLADQRAAAADDAQKDQKLSLSVVRNDALLVSAAMAVEELRPACVRLVDAYQNAGSTELPPAVMSFLRRLRATAIMRQHSPETVADAFFRETPSLWMSAGNHGLLTDGGATGCDQPIWLTHEEHINRLAGPGDDLLLFRYPLTGAFELKTEVAVIGEGAAGLCYGGTGFDANTNWFTVTTIGRPDQAARQWPFIAPQEFRLFNRANFRSDGAGIMFLSNLHPGWRAELQDCAGSPWLGLRAIGTGRIYFRNLEVVGTPRIPQEVVLTASEGLAGWAASYGEQLPQIQKPFPTRPPQPSPDREPDWFVEGDELRSRGVADPKADELNPAHLAYIRPCQPGETVRCEFYYQPGQNAVHPTLGRVAFLLEEGGVRLRWLTDLSTEWTGLEADNAIVEPLNRRGGGTLPLKANDWNSVSMKLTDAVVTLTLNDQVIYERPVDEITDRRFGLYHDRSRSEVRVRNVVLTGDWPETIPEEQLKRLVAADSQPDQP